MEHRFAAARWQTGVTGCPQLEKALVSFDCRISRGERRHHDILFCAIEAIHRHATPYGLACLIAVTGRADAPANPP